MRTVPRSATPVASAFSAFVLALFAIAVPSRAVAQISNEEYAARRAALVQQVQEPQAIVIAMGSAQPPEDYIAFYQNSPFRYLTGFVEPNAALLMAVRNGRIEREILFVNPRNPAREVWDGFRVGPGGTRADTGIEGRSADDLKAVFDSLLAAGWRGLAVANDYDPRAAVKDDVTQRIDALFAPSPGGPGAAVVRNLSGPLGQLRGVKSAAEIGLIQRAVEITVLAQREIMGAATPGMNEFELQGLLEYTFRRYGSERPSFSTIVGSGPNSTTLHYNDNDRFMQDGDMVVADIGASYGGYAADVTRTFPVSGRFTEAQRQIYQLVRDAQAAGEEVARPGVSGGQVEQTVTSVLAYGLADLGLIEAANAAYVDENGQQMPQYRLFYMHSFGHGIGLDVHDPWPRTLEANVPFTIEPGIYVRANLLTEVIPDVPANRALRQRLAGVLPRYVNIGVRIEDDYVVTSNGVDWISRAPREIQEIEALMARPWMAPEGRNGAWVERYRDVQ